jgi:hypothetical protein
MIPRKEDEGSHIYQFKLKDGTVEVIKAQKVDWKKIECIN